MACINVEGEYLVVVNKTTKARVKAEGIKSLLPTPEFIWDEEVRAKEEPFRQGFIDSFFWHHKDQRCVSYTG